MGYGQNSILTQSSLTTCAGTYAYSSLNCTGPSTLFNPLPQDSCQPNDGGFGLRIGGNGQAYRVGCSASYSELPTPFSGNSIVLYQYNNDLCAGFATEFSKLPLELPYTSR